MDAEAFDGAGKEVRTMNATTARTADMAIRELRAELHTARCIDGDHSPRRLFDDAQKLDMDLWPLGILTKRTTWGADPEEKKSKK